MNGDTDFRFKISPYAFEAVPVWWGNINFNQMIPVRSVTFALFPGELLTIFSPNLKLSAVTSFEQWINMCH